MTNLTDLSVQNAYACLQDNPDTSVLLDIRSSMEFLFVGHAVGSIHVAWIDEPDWEVNPDFTTEVFDVLARRFADSDPKIQMSVVLICRSGKRSRLAGKALLEAGFEKVFHITEGFEGERDENDQRSTLGGWRFHGLPWEQC